VFKKYTVLLLTVLLSISLCFPVFAQDKANNDQQNIKIPKTIVLNGTSVDVQTIPEIKTGQVVETKGTTLLKEVINPDGTYIVHEVVSKDLPKSEITEATVMAIASDVYNGHSYAVNDYFMDGTYLGTIELDTIWYTNAGYITSKSNNCWGSIPYYQLPDYWNNITRDFYTYNNNTEGTSWGQGTDNYVLPPVMWYIGYRTFHLQTNVNGSGGYSDSYYIAAEG